jgi:GNAT superfamily N-acetyltransferase
MDAELTIRPARPGDRPAMERICAHTWDWGDYVPEVWDHWLAASGAVGVIVGELAGRVVALSKITFQTPDQVWLEAMRVDPDYRRRGIAGRFLEFSLAHARARGARVARLGTGHHNQPVHLLAARAGMACVGSYELLTAGPLDSGLRPTFLDPGHAALVGAFLSDSAVLAHTCGLYSADWAWQELSAKRVTQFLAQGQLAAGVAADGRLLALATVHPDREEGEMWVGFADGEPEAVAELASAIRAYAPELGIEKVRMMVPDLAWLRAALGDAGYSLGDWEGDLWIFERWLAREPHAGDPGDPIPDGLATMTPAPGGRKLGGGAHDH